MIPTPRRIRRSILGIVGSGLGLLFIPGPGADARTKAEERAPAPEPGAAPADSASTPAPKRVTEAEIEALRKQLEDQTRTAEELRQALESLHRRVTELEADSLGRGETLQERLSKLETSVETQPEVPPDIVSAGDFPGSIRIPGTDAAIKISGLIWAGFIETLDALGSEDRFLTHTIPVSGSELAGKGPRLSFWANPSRFSFDVRTPTKVGQMRGFIEGDFASSSREFRLRHAYVQYNRFILGQTWSTFSDPEADHEDLDFEGINAENVQRQAQARYTFLLKENLKFAFALEQPIASFEGAASVSQLPDLVVRIYRSWTDAHLQCSLVYRQLRGEPTGMVNTTVSAVGFGGSLSGVFPVRVLTDLDRIIFEVTAGQGISRYINDLNSAGEQDAVFDTTAGDLRALAHGGFYLVLEHHWLKLNFMEEAGFNDLRSSLIWGYVGVDNLDIQAPGAYHRTHRVSGNLVWSPVPRLDLGIQFIWGQRENKNGSLGTARQLQFRTRFLF